MRNTKGEIIMSWFCQMVDGKRRCMDWGDYLEYGWADDKSFSVKEHQGVISRKENNNEKDL